RKMAEDAKVACRNARRDALEVFKKMKKDGTVSEDELAGYVTVALTELNKINKK
ncbi:MAG: ribosome recycling factor, partial [Bacteroidaceae bacterium]|nr:ribosome recycling factor [Bacteroidaceae bacterium]